MIGLILKVHSKTKMIYNVKVKRITPVKEMLGLSLSWILDFLNVSLLYNLTAPLCPFLINTAGLFEGKKWFDSSGRSEIVKKKGKEEGRELLS